MSILGIYIKDKETSGGLLKKQWETILLEDSEQAIQPVEKVS